MATIPARADEAAPGLVLGARARWELRKWLAVELEARAPGSASQRLADWFIQALANEPVPWTRLQRAILKQEVWRLLVTLRGSGRDNSGAAAEFEALASELARRAGIVGAGQVAALEVDGRLQEALESVRDWPLV